MFSKSSPLKSCGPVEELGLLFQATLYLHLLWPANGAAGAEGESEVLGYSCWNALAMNGLGRVTARGCKEPGRRGLICCH